MTTTTASPGIVAEARKLRRRYPTMSAANRLRWARGDFERAAVWDDLEFDDNMTARIKRDGFTISVQYTYDEYPDNSWLGHFTNTWEPGAIKHLDGWSGSNYTEPDSYTFGWFIPGNSAEEARQWYAKAGYARHDAWLTAQRQARQDYERIDNITLYMLKVTVFRAGVELAVEYLGGIDLGDDLRDVDANKEAVIMAIDPIDTAIAEAKTTMKTIAVEFTRDATID